MFFLLRVICTCVILRCTSLYIDMCLYTENTHDELQANNFQRLYTCTDPNYCFEVIPANYILGKLPIVQDFVTPTIPSHYNNQKKTAFPRGQANSAAETDNGSEIYYINHFGMTWSRSKICMHR